MIRVPGNVKDLMEEIKDLSELMLDLAYSSVFFESKEIAKEVVLLYSNLEELEEKLYYHLFAASRGRQDRRLISVIDLVEGSKMVASAARNMSEMVLEGAELHPIIKEALKQSDESIVRAMVSRTSVLVNKTLGDVRLRTNLGMNVIAIKRENKWIFDPDKTVRMLKDDILIGIGSLDSCRLLSKLAEGEIKKL